MNYIEVLLADYSFHGKEALTYATDLPLKNGQIVLVPLRRKLVLGIVMGFSQKPNFTIKPIKRVVTDTPLPAATLRLLDWLSSYYPAPWGALVQQFLPSGLQQQARHPATPQKPEASFDLPPLTPEQQQAVTTVEKGKSNSFMLHGDTGTGKTRVYLELVRAQLAQGHSALVLTPEISLTPQLEQQFKQTFASQVFVIHSQLTAAHRRDIWLQVLQATEPVVVIGPRSALFSPIQHLGIIIVDEAHETAYKQEQAPYYQALRVAAKLSELHGAKLVLGSATPTVHDYFVAEAKQVPIIRMQELPLGTKTKTIVQVINLRDRDHFTRQPHLSNDLLEALQHTLLRN